MTLEIVAEIASSHGQDLARAKRLCLQAKLAGADAIKLQTYTPDTISLPGAGLCPSGPWKGMPLYELYQKAHMPRLMQDALINFLDGSGIPWFSTPFSPEDVEWLEKRGCPRYKISSFDVGNEPLEAAILRTGKPIIVSDGMGAGGFPFHRAITRLRCVSQYPAHPKDYALRVGSWDGISDHTTGPTLGIMAIAMGCRMIEKHVCLDDDRSTPDHMFAAPLRTFRKQVREWRRAEEIAGATERPKPDLAAIRPQPMEIDGETVWRRVVR